MPRFSLASVLTAGALAALSSTTAHAHFMLNSPSSWMSQDNSGGPQKAGPCAATAILGDTLGTPTGIVSAFQPGQTVSVSVTATIPHPGWFRIALSEGPSSSQTLTSLPDPPTQTSCTVPIMTNPVWSTTQPVLADGLPAGSNAMTTQTGTKTFQVTIPQNAVCTAARPCALQVIMVMTDHMPSNNCYYHHCADISVGGSATDAGARDARDAAGSTTTGAGGTAGSTTGRGGAGGGTTGGGGGGTTGAGGMVGGTGGTTSTGGTTATTGAGGSSGGSSSTTAGEGGSPGGSSTGGAGSAGNNNTGGSSGGCSMGGGLASGSGGALILLALAAIRRRRR